MPHKLEITPTAAATVDPDFNQLRNVVLPDAKKQPDRSLVIVMSSVIDDALSQVIINHLVESKKTTDIMFSGMGPLSTFSAKINLGFLLALYNKDFADMLHALRKIRNEFAHNMNPLTLESEEVKQGAAALALVLNRFALPPKVRTSRELFVAGCEFMLGGLAAMSLDRRRLKSPKAGQKATRTPS